MDEFAMGSSTETSYFGPARNPFDPKKVPGGSSGGSAVVVALGYVPVALGSDTGGSVRQPAAFCGVLGFRPSYGRISRFGLVSFASSLDTIGLIGLRVEEVATVLSIVEGEDPRDPTSEAMERTQPSELSFNPKEVRVGLLREHLELAKEEVREGTLLVIERLKESGALVEEVSIRGARYALPTYYVLSSSEVSSNLSRYFGCIYGHRPSQYGSWEELMKLSRSEGFGKEVKRRIIAGTFVLSQDNFEEYYARALVAKRELQKEVDEVFEKYDLLLGPATPSLPFGLGEVVEPVEMYHSDITTVFGSVAELPCGVVPVVRKDGLPVAVQVHAKHGRDQMVLKMMRWLEKEFDFIRKNNPRGLKL
jgi:aspartyl-tRNA(Asn)/glutamyl-tRNA(Gln) amidotransferase subunit A